MTGPVVLLEGRSLGCADVRELARGQASAALDEDGVRRAQVAAQVAARIVARREFYDRTAGVGANRDQVVDPADLAAHGLRLRRSHAGGGGALIAAELSRAMLVVRANQLLARGSGREPG